MRRAARKAAERQRRRIRRAAVESRARTLRPAERHVATRRIIPGVGSVPAAGDGPGTDRARVPAAVRLLVVHGVPP